jgi:hypothetical protein
MVSCIQNLEIPVPIEISSHLSSLSPLPSQRPPHPYKFFCRFLLQNFSLRCLDKHERMGKTCVGSVIPKVGSMTLYQLIIILLQGIDNRVRRKFKGMYLMPNIGYGSAKATRHMMPSGFRKVSHLQCCGSGSGIRDWGLFYPWIRDPE